MKAITHSQKDVMLQYFEVLEIQLRRALKEAAATGAPTTGPAFVERVAARVHDRVTAIAAQTPGASAPSLQQIRKNLDTVLDPTFFRDAKGDPIKAVRSLLQQLRYQREYTPPKGGMWRPAKPARGRKAR